jgi:hypothetical protein
MMNRNYTHNNNRATPGRNRLSSPFSPTGYFVTTRRATRRATLIRFDIGDYIMVTAPVLLDPLENDLFSQDTLPDATGVIDAIKGNPMNSAIATLGHTNMAANLFLLQR